MSIDWEEKARLTVAQSTTWQVVKELSPILPGMTPGDFPTGALSDFDGSQLSQLCATAMKSHPLQVIMLQTLELVWRCCAGAGHRQNPGMDVECICERRTRLPGLG